MATFAVTTARFLETYPQFDDRAVENKLLAGM